MIRILVPLIAVTVLLSGSAYAYEFAETTVGSPVYDGGDSKPITCSPADSGNTLTLNAYGAKIVPEPTALIALSSGIIGLWGLNRRR